MTKSLAEQARDLQDDGAKITLDGKEARISGFKLDFAKVWTVSDHARSCEFAWETVVRILQQGGEFKS